MTFRPFRVDQNMWSLLVARETFILGAEDIKADLALDMKKIVAYLKKLKA